VHTIAHTGSLNGSACAFDGVDANLDTDALGIVFTRRDD